MHQSVLGGSAGVCVRRTAFALPGCISDQPLRATQRCDISNPTSLHGSLTNPRFLRRKRACSQRPAIASQAAAGSGPPANMTTLISFDVDGTLIRSAGEDSNRLHKLAFAEAMKKVFDVDTNIDVIKHHGSTDPLILVSVLEHHGVSHDEAMAKLPEMEVVMNKYFVAHAEAAGNGLVVLPGVVALLQALKDRGDVVTCLVTGNLQPIGWGKMDALGLLPYFTEPRFGGFGSDYCSGNHRESWKDRAELVRVAAKRAQEVIGGGVAVRIHVGDTPMDLQAADGAGARGVGVTTGIYSHDELTAASPDSIILPGLEDLNAALQAFGLQQ